MSHSTRGSAKGISVDGSVIKSPINMAKDDGESSIKDNSLFMTVKRCGKESSAGLQEADYVGKFTDQNDKYQEDIVTRKSRSTKKNLSVMNQDILW
jgi:hypothetical protein